MAAASSSSSSSSSPGALSPGEVLSARFDGAGFTGVSVTISAATNTLHLSGAVHVHKASELNLLVAEYLEENPSVAYTINRDALTFPGARSATWHEDDEIPKTTDLNADEIKEYFDSPELLTRKLRLVAREISRARYFVAHTGAGISTAADIPDFRGPQGVWSRRDRNEEAPEGVTLEDAQPTYAHNCLVRLLREGKLGHVVSQNIDGLHLKSGIPTASLSELHGNCYIERCLDCKIDYLRSYDIWSRIGPHFKGVKDDRSESGLSHLTGRKCDTCQGPLRDTLVHFTENLPRHHYDPARVASLRSDFALCLGTSLYVPPACHLPELVAKVEGEKKAPGKFCLVNLQRTGKDEAALRTGGVLIHAYIDDVMAGLMRLMNIDFPPPPRKLKAVQMKVETPEGMAQFNTLMRTRSYVNLGSSAAAQDDLTMYLRLARPPARDTYPHALRWYNHLTASPAVRKRLLEMRETKAREEKEGEAKKERSRSSLVIAIKPAESDTDMDALEEAVRRIRLPGLVWGTSSLEHITHGVHCIQISCVIDDDTSVPELEEAIEAIPLCQSQDILSFNTYHPERGDEFTDHRSTTEEDRPTTAASDASDISLF